jgi:hypothetical protein
MLSLDKTFLVTGQKETGDTGVFYIMDKIFEVQALCKPQ